MQLIAVLAWIAGGVLALIAAPWVAFGFALAYFKALRRGTDTLAWFDLPALAVMLVSGALINISTLAICVAVKRVTGRELLSPPPHWRGARPSGRAA